MAFNPTLYVEVGKLKAWEAGSVVPADDWDQDTILLLFGIPSWSIDAELILMNWRDHEDSEDRDRMGAILAKKPIALSGRQ